MSETEEVATPYDGRLTLLLKLPATVSEDIECWLTVSTDMGSKPTLEISQDNLRGGEAGKPVLCDLSLPDMRRLHAFLGFVLTNAGDWEL